jgi:23S rRNA (cytidine2498-2'-O)-methyltransferase
VPFLLTTCAVGAEPVLRRLLPTSDAVRPAFARPGLVTFKTDGEVAPDAPRPHPLVRAWAVSLGQRKDDDGVRAAADSVPAPSFLHTWAGEAGPPGRVPPKVLNAWDERARAEDERLRALLGDRVRAGLPQVGDAVLDVIVRPDEPLVLGWHRHTAARGPLPGGAWDLVPPADAPSRAWKKLEELCAWSGADPRGDRVLEIGSAPGGATVALLDRGCDVVGVDPQPVRLPERLAGASFRSVRKAIEGVPRDDLPDDVVWIVLDADVAAPVALRSLDRLVPRYRRTLRGLLLTLKLNDWELATRLPEFFERLRSLGATRVEAAHLPSFRQELGAVAWLP